MTSKRHQLTAIDLFSGCGGLTTGLKQVGFRVVAAVEMDALATSTYRTNHPEVTILETDIRRLAASNLKKKLHLRRGRIDLIAGCPPCQGFSAMRTLNGSRSVRDGGKNLVFEFVRFVRALLPKTIMMENVPALAEDKRMRDVLRQLSKLGYKSECRILDVADYGVPQRRRRMILLGSRYENVQFARPSAKRKSVRDAIGSMPKPGRSGDPLHDLVGKHGLRVATLIKRISKNGGSRTQLSSRYQLQCHKATSGFKDVYGRMAWDRVAPTITTGCVNPSKGRFLHPTQNRAITLREAALLQSFPSTYYFSLESGRFPVAAMIGKRRLCSYLRMRYGRGVHNLMREIHSNPKEWSRLAKDPAALRERLDQLVKSGLFYLRYTTGDPLENMQKKALRIISDYVQLYQGELDKLQFEPEREFETLIEEEQLLVSGAIDIVRLDDPPRVTLIDFKSGEAESDIATKLTEEELKLQVGIYGLAAKHELEYEPDRGLVRYLGEDDPTKREMGITLDESAIAGARKTVVGAAKEIRDRRFYEGPRRGPRNPKSSVRCAECDFADFCGMQAAKDFRTKG